ncbi:alpha/beta fold hydrolase [Micrococcus sp.]|uniref:alpha/beta fold hydrolase n=1 Tax=Micrococcus sp. TaxID=1271 RepID=UPI002A91B00F|nr:alpha/beta fold hydrolase [Micrococcus sp.]MDY6054602.1 alpha/beta fold hydrolase [Micrococcus sp.]
MTDQPHASAAPSVPPTGADLSSVTVGNGPRRVVFIHGLMGRGRNFTGVAKALGGEFSVHLVDLPDHGLSPWTDHVDYREIADRVAAHLRADFAADGPVHVLGHSMGGKVAMVLALRHPDLVDRLVVVDIAPRLSPNATGQFSHLLGTMLAMDLDSLQTRADADAAMAEQVPDERIRAFLLQNLRRDHGRFVWQANVEMLRENLAAVGAFPEPVVEEDPDRVFDHPVLWLGGADSDYIQDKDVPQMKAMFPRVVRVMVRGASHWVHADQPAAFVSAVEAFLTAED